MRPKRTRDEAPAFEPFRYRAEQLNRAKKLRLCNWCLQGRRRCQDSKRHLYHQRSWKAFRRLQYRP